MIVVARRPRAAPVTVAAALAAIGATLAACGSSDTRETAAALPMTAGEYRERSEPARLAAAAGCRDRQAQAADGVAARQIAAIDAELLRRQLDIALADHRTGAGFEGACAATVPLVTPGLRVRFAGATGRGLVFSYPTRSDRPLTIRGTIEPAPASGRVIARRENGKPLRVTAAIDERGQFVVRDLPLRKVADNSFLLSIEAPPNAPRLVRFSALCLDCIISGSGTAAGVTVKNGARR